MMNFDDLLNSVNNKLIETHSRPLNFAEVLILKGIWQYQTYQEIAQQGGYSPGYLTNVVAPELFRRLSELIDKRVTKKNCRILLESYVTTLVSGEEVSPKPEPRDNTDVSPCYPSGAVSLNSPFYIERSLIETEIYEEIQKPGALVRIKAPQEMGKTSLLLRVLNQANYLNYKTVILNLEQIDRSILSDLKRFLRWLCADVTRQLKLDSQLGDYWDEDIGSKISCTLYFEGYLLEKINSPLILALDAVHHIFEYPQVAQAVLPLLRSWYEEAKRLPIWQKLRLMVVYSTEIYVPLQLNQSPFNVGLPIELNNFTLEQVQQLIKRYGLNSLKGEEAQELMNLVKGHPALVHIALYHLSRKEVTLSQLLETASTSSGIYRHHLQHHWTILREQLELTTALQMVINSTEPVQLDPIIAYKLSSMGLVKQLGNTVLISCELYRQYFKNQYL